MAFVCLLLIYFLFCSYIYYNFFRIFSIFGSPAVGVFGEARGIAAVVVGGGR